jgi:hypothetical protein
MSGLRSRLHVKIKALSLSPSTGVMWGVSPISGVGLKFSTAEITDKLLPAGVFLFFDTANTRSRDPFSRNRWGRAMAEAAAPKRLFY